MENVISPLWMPIPPPKTVFDDLRLLILLKQLIVRICKTNKRCVVDPYIAAAGYIHQIAGCLTKNVHAVI